MKEKRLNKTMSILIIFGMMVILGIVSYRFGMNDYRKSLSDSVNDTNRLKTTNSIKLTRDNWKDYFEITREIKEEKNAFGDIVNTYDFFVIKLKEPYYSNGYLENTAIKLSNPFQEDLTREKTLEFKDGINQSKTAGSWADDVKGLTIDELEFTQIMGTLYY